jgi:hypothetical protein
MTIPAAASPAPTLDEDAAAVISRLIEAIVRIEGLLQEETALVRAARLREAATVAAHKAAAASLYERELVALRAVAGVILRTMPERAQELRARLAALGETLAVNLAVVGTAKAVAEDMMRSVADEVGRRNQPHGYGSHGRAVARAGTPAPVSISRNL